MPVHKLMRIANVVVVIALLSAVLVGCAPAAPPADFTAEPDTPRGAVTIISPLTGSTIYAEALFVTGTAQDVPENRFRLRVVTADDVVLAQPTVTVEEGMWSVEIVHEYDGVPTEALLIAENAAGGEYDVESVVIASMDNRPEGTFGAILSPQEGMVVGGDQIEVTGTGSGLFENTLLLQLREPDGAVISETVVTVANPYFVDEIVWIADLETNGHTGPAIVHIGYEDAATGERITLDEEEIMVSEVAG